MRIADSIHPVLPIALAALLASACDKPAPPPPPPPPAVNVIQVAPREVPVLVEAVGRTEGSKEVEVRARVSGILGSVLYSEGSPVRAGAPLFQIDRAPFEIALAQARAALAQERAKNEQTQREAERLKDLVAKKAISQREADDAASSFKTSNAAIQAAEAKVREAELNLSYTAVGAPIAGVTGRALRSQGSLVTAGTDSSLLTTLSQTDPLWVRFSLSEAERQVLNAGRAGGKNNEVRLLLPDGKTHPVKGRLNFSGSSVDTRLGTVQLRAEFANPGLGLLPGQFVRAQVVAGTQEAIVVPQSAVLQGDAGRFVWTLGPENKATPRPVETGAWLGPDWIIQKGLKAGDRVIVDNLLRLRPGVTVQPQAPGGAKAGQPGAPGPAGAPSGTAPGAPAGNSPVDAKKAG
jgi:membrane fusion protein (multidrug efflux system)